MSWLSELFSNDAPPVIQKPDPNAVANYYDILEANNPTLYAQLGPNSDPNYAAKQAKKAAALVPASGIPPSTASPTTADVAPTNGVMPTTRPPLAAGFANELLPSSFAEPYISSSLATSRSGAEDFINNMLKRGTTTASGAAAAKSSLSAQDPTVRQQISDISNTILNQGRSDLGSYGPVGDIEGATAAAQAFQGGFGSALSGAVPSGLYNTANLGSAAGAAVDPRNLSNDPYAVEGGQLKTGLGAPTSPVAKKRTTAVF